MREVKRQGCEWKGYLSSVEYIEVACGTTKLFYKVDVYV
jgi:hypothetical protein